MMDRDKETAPELVLAAATPVALVVPVLEQVPERLVLVGLFKVAAPVVVRRRPAVKVVANRSPCRHAR